MVVRVTTWRAVLMVAAMVSGTTCAGCGSKTPTAREKAAVGATTSRPTTGSSSAGPTTTAPGASSSLCEDSGGSPAPLPGSARLDRLLLDVHDVPAGYATNGPQASVSGPEFDGAVSTTLPTSYITFSMGSDPGPTSGIIEAVAEAPSVRAATSLLDHVHAVATACDLGAGMTVALPGVVPHLTATTTIGGTSNEYISTADVFTSKGRYLVEVRWFNSQYIPENPVTERQAPGPQPLPTPTVMGSVVDAALTHIPA
jgi:hypothetical protein